MVDNYHLLSLDLSPPRPPFLGLSPPLVSSQYPVPLGARSFDRVSYGPPMPIDWQYTGHVTLRFWGP